MNGRLIDQTTQQWVRRSGRSINLGQEEWLAGPVGSPAGIGDTWLETYAAELGGHVVEGGGLLVSLDDLTAPDFDPASLAQAIHLFYERTMEWEMTVGSEWSQVARPFGWTVAHLFSRRLEQLALPVGTHPAQSIESRVLTIADGGDRQVAAAWIRRLPASDQTMYSGLYRTVQLPGAKHTSLHVCFPLPNGNLSVYLRPSVGPGGSLILESGPGSFSADGAYLSVVEDGRARVRRVTLHERFEVEVDGGGGLRTRHELRFGRRHVLDLNYALRHNFTT